jgi:peptide/nickel transport system ATP-binding protein
VPDVRIRPEANAAERRNGPAVLDVRDLSVAFGPRRDRVEVVSGVSFDVAPGEALGIVGESGSGKSVLCLATMGLVGAIGGHVTSGSITLDGRDVTALSQRQWRALRSTTVSMIFQQPIRSLNPAFTVGDQIAEPLRVHSGLSRRQAWAGAVELLERVRIPSAASRAHDYPHQLSGGMCQRVMIAMALACQPKLIIADEPTTALDVTVQAEILDLLNELRANLGVSLIYVSHDLAVVRELCDRVAVMYAGNLVEDGPTAALFERPRHPYTAGLLEVSELKQRDGRLASIPGQVPAPRDFGSGCRFVGRCDHTVHPRCDADSMPLLSIGDGRSVKCVRHDELELTGRSA